MDCLSENALVGADGQVSMKRATTLCLGNDSSKAVQIIPQWEAVLSFLIRRENRRSLVIFLREESSILGLTIKGRASSAGAVKIVAATAENRAI